MIQYKRIDISERIDFNKRTGSKKCMICHYWYFKDTGLKYQPHVCNGCHDFSMTVQNLSDFFIVTVKNVDYRCYIVGVDKKDVISLLNNSVLGDKGVLKWILPQTKHLLKQLKKVHLVVLILETFILILMVGGTEIVGKNLSL